MPLTYDGVTLADGDNNLAIRAFDALHKKAAKMIAGNVLEVGLGLGVLRRLVIGNPLVTSLVTIELRQDVIDWWRAHGAEFDLDSIEDQTHEIVTGGAKAWVEQAVLDGRTFDVIMVDADDVPRKAGVAAAFRSLQPNAGQRLIVQWQGSAPSINGYKRRAMKTFHGRTLYVFDRWDPSQGIGSARPGARRVPGQGWV